MLLLPLFLMRLYLTIAAATAPTIVAAAMVAAHVAPVLKPRKICSTPLEAPVLLAAPIVLAQPLHKILSFLAVAIVSL